MWKEVLKAVLWALAGMAIFVGIMSLVVCIGAAANGVTFAQQIVDWFGPKAKAVVETVSALQNFAR